MTDRPTLFSGPMIRALLDDRKTQTRRILKDGPMPSEDWFCDVTANGLYWVAAQGTPKIPVRLPYATGDRLWVRETFRQFEAHNECGCSEHPCPCPVDRAIIFRADHDSREDKWKPSIFMPRSASRLTLPVTAVRVQRLQDISEEDAIAEGVILPFCTDLPEKPATRLFRQLWNSLNEKRGYGWDVNPWIAALTFEVHKTNIDDMPEATA